MIDASHIEKLSKLIFTEGSTFEDHIETLSTLIITLSGSMLSTPGEPGSAITPTDANVQINHTVASEIALPGLQKASYRKKVVFIKLKEILKVLAETTTPLTTDVGINIYPTVNNFVNPAVHSCVLELAYYNSVVTYVSAPPQNTYLFNFGTSGGNKTYSQLDVNY